MASVCAPHALLSQPDGDDFPEWVRRVPLSESPELDALTVRDVAGCRWSFWEYPRSVFSARGDLHLPSPFQDWSDRPEQVMMLTTAGSIPIGLFFSARYLSARRASGMTVNGKVVMATAFSLCAKYMQSFAILSLALIAGDALSMDISRRIANRQGVTLGMNEDVERRPVHYACAYSLAASTFTFMDVARPIPLLWNLARWSSAGFVVGYGLGTLKYNAKKQFQREGTDDGVAKAMRESLHADVLREQSEARQPEAGFNRVL